MSGARTPRRIRESPVNPRCSPASLIHSYNPSSSWLPGPSRSAQAGLLTNLAGVLSNAQDKLVAHKDIKPEYILLSANGTAVLSFVGIAKSIDEIKNLI